MPLRRYNIKWYWDLILLKLMFISLVPPSAENQRCLGPAIDEPAATLLARAWSTVIVKDGFEIHSRNKRKCKCTFKFPEIYSARVTGRHMRFTAFQITDNSTICSTSRSGLRQRNIKKSRITGLLLGESTGDWWVYNIKGRQCGKGWHVRTSSLQGLRKKFSEGKT